MVDARDVADVATHIATAPAAHHGSTYWLSGPETLSYDDAATQLSALLHRAIRHHRLTVDEQRSALLTAGAPPAAAHDTATVLQLFSHGDFDWATTDVPRILGRPARSFLHFAADDLAAFTTPTAA